MTYETPKLSELQEYMHIQTGLPYNSLGTVPDPNHDGGYHCGWDQRRITNGSLDDYSWEESPRDWNHKTNACRAFDLGMFPLLRDISVWIVNQCALGAPDTLDIREIIYSPDGKTVKRWDRLRIHSGGDSSHLTHTHFDWFADAEHRDKVGIFKRYYRETQMSDWTEPSTTYGTDPDGHYRSGEQWTRDLYAGFWFGQRPVGTDGQPVGPPPWLVDQIKALQQGMQALLQTPPGSVDEELVRRVVREELDNTRLVERGEL